MKRPQFTVSFAFLIGSFLLLPVVKAGKNSGEAAPVAGIFSENENTSVAGTSSMKTRAMELYEELSLDKKGMNSDAMVHAYTGHHRLVGKGLVKKSNILTVIDFSQSSSRKRMYILDVESRKLLIQTYVAHGKNSGYKYAEKFSNRHESLQSSLGFYVTKHTYYGKHGLSLRLGGLEYGINHNAESRAIVLHGADYIGDHRVGSSFMGRSFGCPAVPRQLSSRIINLIRDGSTMFIYHPSKSYLKGSPILNG